MKKERTNRVTIHKTHCPELPLITIYISVFFFPVKTKSRRESHFWHFLQFFSRVQNHFHARIFDIFHGQSGLFTDTFKDFFTGMNFFSRAEKCKFSRVGILFSRTEIGLSPMVEGDLDFDLSWVGTLILKYYQLNVQDAVFRVCF